MNIPGLKGKKLLVISSDASDIAFVEAARELGTKVVCCDRYSDWSISPAKGLADEAWNIDYKNTDLVAEKCREFGIDGVIAGYGEERVMAACKIAEAIGTPFYASCEQIELTRNKKTFKALCRQYGIGVPEDYAPPKTLEDPLSKKIHYPVIVKPADSGGRKGISICTSGDQLEEALELAGSHSLTGDIVIEDYLEGIELSAVYTLKDGEISLSCLNDKYVARHEGGPSKLCDLVVTPSSHLDRYLKDVDSRVRALLEGIGAKNGVANFQFIVSDEGIRAFEMGYRVNGNDDFKVIRSFNGLDFMKMLISHSLTGSMGASLARDNPRFPAYAATLVFHVREGKVGRIFYGKLADHPAIEDISLRKRAGSVVGGSGTNEHKAMMVKMRAPGMADLADLIRHVQENVLIEDQEGDSMLLPPFNIDRLKESDPSS